MAKKKKITAETKFVRCATFTAPDGKKVCIQHQPYVVGIYQVMSVDGKLAGQGGVRWDGIDSITEKSVRKSIVDGATDIEITVAEVGKFISESDLEIVNR